LIRLQNQFADLWPLERTICRPAAAEHLRPLYLEWGFKTLLAELGPVEAQQNLF
jgi:hypothetical protein